MNRKRRFGDRSDGYKVRSLAPMFKVSPYIMKKRSDACNFLDDSIDIENAEKYIAEKRKEGLKGLGMLHLIVAAYVRTISQRPGINRFINGQKIYARNNIEINLAIKKDMKLNSMDTIIKLEVKPDATIKDIYDKFNTIIEENRTEGDVSNFDSAARVIDYIPGLVKKFTVWLLSFLDYFGLLPRFLTRLSPFHGSFFITSMGSLGIPPIYHHIYDFGNVPVFCSYGAKRTQFELNREGKVIEKKYVDYKFVTDERICDGHYFASALKMFKSYMKNPECLTNPPEEVVEDID
ncbi:MAG: hypothetical protein A2Y17_05115 [Clostridiales bacterium GWF2_38_85]|nr:MAG: hypothetical protein A2Y17_05115 [Clostridiales bacterium GWF2_38_85]HBL84837.1 hypothetical protein [Clostridiales bacterium]